MHYDYSSHKYVFSISNNFRSLLPDVSPIMNKRYNICAVVGNSGILTGSQCGQEIDKSDFVFRCNFAPTEAFQKDVGRKTNLTTFNPSILEKYYNNLLTIQDRNNFFLSLKKLDGAILWIPAFFFHTSATVTRTLVDFFVEHRGQLKVQLAWHGRMSSLPPPHCSLNGLSRLRTGALKPRELDLIGNGDIAFGSTLHREWLDIVERLYFDNKLTPVWMSCRLLHSCPLLSPTLIQSS